MSVLPISFTKALNLTADTKRHLLLGNGFQHSTFPGSLQLCVPLRKRRFHAFTGSAEGF